MMFGCDHKWQVLDKTVIPSKMEVMGKNMRSFAGINGSAFPLDFDTLAKETVVITFSCERCGKLKIVKETN